MRSASGVPSGIGRSWWSGSRASTWASDQRQKPQSGSYRTIQPLASRDMSIGIITGSGTYALPGFEGGEAAGVSTPFGAAAFPRGTYAGVDALHVSRHLPGHVRLSNQVTHRANIWALKE